MTTGLFVIASPSFVRKNSAKQLANTFFAEQCIPERDRFPNKLKLPIIKTKIVSLDYKKIAIRTILYNADNADFYD
ncbi:MAG: hypothetical protein HGB12_12215 [Bacteroidetes bacterium]|nr:hypothetical protein [Bacteroidota bacterium]